MASLDYRRYFAPIGLLLLAGLLALGSQLSVRNFTSVAAPFDLQSGGVSTFEFQPAYSDDYEIGVAMNRDQAMRLFPCMADFRRSASQSCSPGDFPLELSMDLKVMDGAAPLSLRLDNSISGGHYTPETFTRPLANVRMSAGKTYRLTVISKVDGTPLDAVSPKLVVELATGPQMGKGLEAALIMLLAKALGLIAIVWAGVAFLLDRFRRSRAVA